MTNQIAKACQFLKSGGVVIFPTDTVWGIGAAISSPHGIAKLYRIKKREPKKPTALLVSDLNMAKRYGVINDTASQLASQHWPGALTLIVKTKANVPSTVTGNSDTVGLRAPDHHLATQLIQSLDQPIVTASANFASLQPAATKDQLDPNLVNLADFVLDGEAKGQPASTIVDTTHSNLRIIRSGSVKL